MSFHHIPVLLKEVLKYTPRNIRLIVDLTLGGGNHSAALLEHCPNAFLFGVDRDIEALEAGRIKLSPFSGRYELFHGSFSQALKELGDRNRKADFILADLGVSSHQLQLGERGFSFRLDGPLDMRMNTDDPESAADIVNCYDKSELTRIIGQYGEEQFARQIAQNIVKKRFQKPFSTTRELAECVLESIPKKNQFGKIHPATKTFQAIRIQVNKEIDEIESLLDNALDLLHPGGRLAVISFHSLEDRPIKQRFRLWEDPCNCPKNLPVCICGQKPLVKNLSRKAIKAGAEEMQANARSRSARLRIIEKL